MKKSLYIILVCIITSFSLKAQFVVSTVSNAKLNTLAKQMFGFPLFDKPLLQTLDSIAIRQDFVSDTLINHTDSSLFYFRGYWKDFNPFNQKMDSVKLIVAEIKRNRRLNGKVFTDTFFLVQTEGSLVTPSDAVLRNAFKYLHKNITPYFNRFEYSRDYKQKVWNAEWNRYFLPDSFDYSANITWRKRSASWATVTVTFVTKLEDKLVL